VDTYLAERGFPVQWQAHPMWTIYKREESGELIEVTAAEDRSEAEAVAERMRQLFSAEYVVKETESSEQSDTE